MCFFLTKNGTKSSTRKQTNKTSTIVVDSDRGAEARFFSSTFTFSDDNRDRIQPVLESFTVYCQPLKNVPFERYKFYSRMQEGVVKKG